MKIGFSISPEFVLGQPVDADEIALLEVMDNSSEKWLQWLKQLGVSSIELRSDGNSEPPNTFKAANVIWESGLAISIHGRLDRDIQDGDTLSEVYMPLQGVVQNFPKYQNSLNVTVHAFASKGEGDMEDYRKRTIAKLTEWAAMIERDQQQVYLALELNRSKGKIDPATISSNVAQMVSEVASNHVGICWDMGHYYANGLRYSEPDVISKAFLSKVIHTHIHGVGEQGTHCPLVAPAVLPLEEYLGMLTGYMGIYNLEFDCAKFPPGKGWDRWIAESIARLKAGILGEMHDGRCVTV